jgi:hypothetical protein
LRKAPSGAILILALLFLTILSFVGLSLIGLVVVQSKSAYIKVAQEYSFQIAEAGLNYARWRLAHDPNDFTAVVEQPFADPEGGIIGYYNIEFAEPGPGTNVVNITSAGWYQDNQDFRRILSARYGKKAFTQYSFLTNSNIYFGGGNRDGRIHANGGIRMEAEANSTVTSATDTYIFGVTPTCVDQDEEKDAIWRCDGTVRDLWQYPVGNVDFAKITMNLADFKDWAQCFSDPDCVDVEGNGIYRGNQGQGYHLIFQTDGTVDIYWIQSLEPQVWASSAEKGWFKTSTEIKDEQFDETYTLAGNDLIFIEDDVWVEGTINGRVTVVAARLPSVPGNNPDIILKGNLVYLDKNGDHVLGLLAQHDILMPLKPTNGIQLIPNTGEYEVDAALLAQQGQFTRHFYCYKVWWIFWRYHCSSSVYPYHNFNKITLYGSMISYNQPGNYWGKISGEDYGVLNTVNIYDPQLIYNPPPYFPVAGDYDFISWEEKEKGEQ